MRIGGSHVIGGGLRLTRPGILALYLFYFHFFLIMMFTNDVVSGYLSLVFRDVANRNATELIEIAVQVVRDVISAAHYSRRNSDSFH